jgi:hypothetical protein
MIRWDENGWVRDATIAHVKNSPALAKFLCMEIGNMRQGEGNCEPETDMTQGIICRVPGEVSTCEIIKAVLSVTEPNKRKVSVWRPRH